MLGTRAKRDSQRNPTMQLKLRTQDSRKVGENRALNLCEEARARPAYHAVVPVPLPLRRPRRKPGVVVCANSLSTKIARRDRYPPNRCHPLRARRLHLPGPPTSSSPYLRTPYAGGSWEFARFHLPRSPDRLEASSSSRTAPPGSGSLPRRHVWQRYSNWQGTRIEDGRLRGVPGRRAW